MDRVLNNSYFMPKTQVLTEEGCKNIEDIKVGDFVLTHENEFHRVLDVQTSTKSEVFEVETLNGAKIRCTKNQFFLVAQKKKGIYTLPQKKMACKLNKDDYLVSHFELDGSGHIYYQYDGIKSAKLTDKKENTINLIVENHHTFIVSNNIVYDNSVLVKA